MKGNPAKFAAVFVSIVIGLMSSMAARAEYVPAETPWFSGVPLASLVKGPAGSTISTTQLVWGTSLTVNALAATGRGQVSVRLTDIGWPEALQSMTMLVTDLNGLWHKVDGTSSLLFDVSGPANLFVAVFAQSQDKYQPGLYNLQASFSPVPLPAAAWLLLSGIGGLAAFRRKRSLEP